MIKTNSDENSSAMLKTNSIIALVSLLLLCFATEANSAEKTEARLVPTYQVDMNWPQLPLPNNWVIGAPGGIFVDSRDHVWIVQRPGTLFSSESDAVLQSPWSECCTPAPAVIEFDPKGNVVQAWGGPGEGYDWPTTEHGIMVDDDGNVWIGGSAARGGRDGQPADGMVLKFSAKGEFIMQIGHAAPSEGSLSEGQLSGAADMAANPATNEVFIADGYGNHRVAVFDATTGEFKRSWGAYGKPATDIQLPDYNPAAAPDQQFRTVHCITLSLDNLVYVCDRDNNRVQVFTLAGEFVEEFIYGAKTTSGTVAHISLWPNKDQTMMAITDLGNFQVRIVRREDGKELSSIGRFSSYAGRFNRIHQAVFNSKGDIFTAEVGGKRVLKWRRTGGEKP